MAIIIHSKNPEKFLVSLKEAISNGVHPRWSIDDKEHFAFKGANEVTLGTFVVQNEKQIVFLQSFSKTSRSTLTVRQYALLHSGMLQVLLAHLDTEFEVAFVTSKQMTPSPKTKETNDK